MSNATYTILFTTVKLSSCYWFSSGLTKKLLYRLPSKTPSKKKKKISAKHFIEHVKDSPSCILAHCTQILPWSKEEHQCDPSGYPICKINKNTVISIKTEKKNEKRNKKLGVRKLGTREWWQCKWGRCRNHWSWRCERNRGSGGGRDKPCPYRNRTLFASRSSSPPRSSSRLVALRLNQKIDEESLWLWVLDVGVDWEIVNKRKGLPRTRESIAIAEIFAFLSAREKP